MRAVTAPRRLLAIAVVLAAVLAIAIAIGTQRLGEDATEPVYDQLHFPGVTAVRDELWVYGGLAGPEGSAPPVSSDSPPGWAPNRTVSVYGVDGTLRRQLRLPSGTWPSSPPVAVGDATFFLAGEQLVEIRGDEISIRPLDLPPAELTVTNVLDGPITIGAYGDQILATQSDGLTSSPPVQESDDRLLRIDATTGTAIEIPLPEFVAEIPASLCIDGDQLYAGSATRDDVGGLTQVRVWSRPIEPAVAEWSEVATVDFDGERAVRGALHYLETTNELLIEVIAYPTSLTTISLTDPTATPTTFVLGDESGTSIGRLGEVGGHDVFVSEDHDTFTILRHMPDGRMEPTTSTVPRAFHYVAVDGVLYDATGLTGSTDPARASLERIDLNF